jgi:hypothetical protein
VKISHGIGTSLEQTWPWQLGGWGLEHEVTFFWSL